MFDFFKKKDQNEPQNSENKPEEKKGFFSLTFDNLKKTIEKTSESHVGNVVSRLQDQEEIDKFMELTAPELVFLLFDSGHLSFAGINPEYVLKKYVNRVKHVHLKDIR